MLGRECRVLVLVHAFRPWLDTVCIHAGTPVGGEGRVRRQHSHAQPCCSCQLKAVARCSSATMQVHGSEEEPGLTIASFGCQSCHMLLEMHQAGRVWGAHASIRLSGPARLQVRTPSPALCRTCGIHRAGGCLLDVLEELRHVRGRRENMGLLGCMRGHTYHICDLDIHRSRL